MAITVTMHMIGCIRDKKELEKVKANYLSFLSRESSIFKYIITVDDCCKQAQKWLCIDVGLHEKKVELYILKGNCGIGGAILRHINTINTDYYVTMHNDCLIKKPFVLDTIAKFNEKIAVVGGLSARRENFDSWCVIHDTKKLQESIKNIPLSYTLRVCADNYKEQNPWFYGKYNQIMAAIIKTHGVKCIVADANINDCVQHFGIRRYINK